MRHRRKLNHLSRKSAHRKAMMANMASSLILHKRINTTVAKAKALRTYVEPLITKSKLSVTTKTSKEEATHLRRVVFSYLQNKEAVTELFRDISVKVIDREGGYTRIIKTGARLGDNAEMCMMELVDYNENLLTDKSSADSKSRKRRRGAKKKVDETAAPLAAAAKPVAEVVEEATEEAAPEVVAEVEATDEKDKEIVAEADTTTEVVEEKVEEVVAGADTTTEVVEEKVEEVVAEVDTTTEVVEEKVEEVVAEEPVAEVKAEEEKAEETPEDTDDETKKDQ